MNVRFGPVLSLCLALGSPLISAPRADAQTVDVTYTLGATAGTLQPLVGINAGPLHWSTATGTKDATLGLTSIGVKSVRSHDFPGAFDMSVMYPDRTKDPSQSSSYNFSTGGSLNGKSAEYGSDAAATAVKAAGATLHLRIWDSSADLAVPSLAERANWIAAVVQIVRHYQQGQWNGFTNLVTAVEIGNEPDSSGFWPSTSSREDFYALYSETALALRSAFPTLKIGGPGVTEGAYKGNNGQAWIKAFLDYIKRTGAPLDFLSWHTYTNTPDDYGTGATYLRTELTNRGFTNTEQFVTEWHTSVTPTTDQTQDAANVETRTMGKAAALTTTSWITMQQSGVTQAFIYRANDPGASDLSRYGIFDTNALPRKTALAFSLWSEFAAYTDRIDPVASVTVTGLKALAAQRADGQLALLVANTGSATRRFTVAFADTRRLSNYTLSLETVDDSHTLVSVSAPTGTTVDIAPNTVQLLTLNAHTGSYAASASAFGTTTGLVLSGTIQVAGSDIGRAFNVYVARIVNGQYAFYNGASWVSYTSGSYPSYSSGVLPAVISIPIYSASTSVQSLLGAQFLIGYGTSSSEMLSAGRFRTVFTVPSS